MLKRLINQRGLILQLLKNDLAGRYKGTFLGIIWSLLNPLIMLGIYYVLFSVVFQPRWKQNTDESSSYALFILSGILIHTFMAEVLTRSPLLIPANPNFVKKVVFPLAMLPVGTVLSAFVNFLIGFTILSSYVFIFHGFNPVMLVVFPLCTGSMLLMMLGFSYLLSSTGIYFRDIGQIMTQVASILFFMGPALYPADAAPEMLKSLMMLNPMTIPIQEIRSALLQINAPNYIHIAEHIIASLIIFMLGYLCFRKLRKGFADVI